MKEKPKNPLARAAGIAEGVASAMRRMQRDREPRVLLYDETGYARRLQPGQRGQSRALDAARKMVEQTAERREAA